MSATGGAATLQVLTGGYVPTDSALPVRCRRLTLVLCSALLLCSLITMGSSIPARAATVPFDPILSSEPIEGYVFNAQVTAGYAIDVCFGRFHDGTAAAYDYIESVFGWPTHGTRWDCREMYPRPSNLDCNGTVVNPITQPLFHSTCWSNHAQGRALDLMVQGNAPSPEPLGRGNALVDWLLAADPSGNQHARARRLGVQQIIWNDRCWRSSTLGDSAVTRASDMRVCGQGHFDHIHLDFTLSGADGMTSAYTGSARRAAGGSDPAR
jgi:hypothetical protein